MDGSELQARYVLKAALRDSVHPGELERRHLNFLLRNVTEKKQLRRFYRKRSSFAHRKIY